MAGQSLQESPSCHPFLIALKKLLDEYPELPCDVKKLGTQMIEAAGETGFVYHIICTVNGRGYVGQTTNLQQRIYNHIQDIGGNGGSKSILWHINFAKYGISHYKVEVLESGVPAVKLLEREKYWQSIKRAVLSSEEIRRSINASLKEKTPSWKAPRFWKNGGSDWDDKTIDQMLSPEQKEIIDEIVRRYGHTDQPCDSTGIPLENFIKRAAMQVAVDFSCQRHH